MLQLLGSLTGLDWAVGPKAQISWCKNCALILPLLQGIGDDPDSVVSSSATIAESEAGYLPVFFEPRPLLNLQLVDQMPSLGPITDMKVRTCLRVP